MAPDFSQPTVTLLGYRSSVICNNPDCMTITVGPDDANGPLKLKLGEAAHICAARKDEPRYERSMTDDARAHFDNGIWLCASCHTLIDKNKGAGFPAKKLREWKKQHEDLIRGLLLSHRSPMPLLRQFTEEGRYAQQFVDLLSQHGAFFVHIDYEIGPHVEDSLGYVRKEGGKLLKKIEYDKHLRDTIAAMLDGMRTYMNETGAFTQHRRDGLLALRNKLGVLLKRLRDEFGCKINGDLNRILP